jgi:hypothetical protein
VIIDCDTCEVRGLACGDCVVSVLLGGPPQELDDGERAAIGVLAESGLVPPLRLVRPFAGPADDPADDPAGDGTAGGGGGRSAAAG